MVDFGTTESLESLRQLIRDICDTAVKEYRVVLQHDRAAKPEERGAIDESIVKLKAVLTGKLTKFNNMVSREIFKDAKNLAALAEKNPAAASNASEILQHLEDILKEVEKSHREDKRKDHFLLRLAHKLSKNVKKLVKGVRTLEHEHNKLTKKYKSILEKGAQPEQQKGKLIQLFKKR